MEIPHPDVAGDSVPKEPRGSHWTPDRIDRLKVLWGKGLSLNEIASTLGNLTRNQVVGKVHRLNLPGRPSPLVPAASAWYRKAASADKVTEAFPIAVLADFSGFRDIMRVPGSVDAVEAERLANVQRVEAERVEAERLANVQRVEAERVEAERKAAQENLRRTALQRADSDRRETAKLEALFNNAKGASAAVQSLRAGACKWPIGDPRDADFHFCNVARKGKAYCDEHAKLAYVEPHSRARIRP